MTKTLLAYLRNNVIVAERSKEVFLFIGESKHMIGMKMTEFDLVDMDGLKFIEKLLGIRSLPVIFLSMSEMYGLKIQCLLKGADPCFDKPIDEYTARNLWQFSVNKRYSPETSRISDNIQITPFLRNDHMPILENREEFVEDDCIGVSRKRKTKWTPELHDKFVIAVDSIGYDDARPKRILQLMNIPELTLENVASHLQRYRTQRNGKAVQTMPIGIAQTKSFIDLNPELRAAATTILPFPPGFMPELEGSVPKTPYKGIGFNIYNKLAMQLNVHKNSNVRNDIPDLNLDPNVDETSGDEHGNPLLQGIGKKYLARGRMPSEKCMNAYHEMQGRK